jgi:hypothetical protein
VPFPNPSSTQSFIAGYLDVRARCFFHTYATKKFCGCFRQDRVDEHARPQLEPGGSRQARNHADVPVKMARPHVVRGAAAHREVEVGIVETYVELGQEGSQNSRQVGDLGGSNFSEGRHVAQGKYVSGEWRRRGEDLHRGEKFALQNDAGLILKFALHHVAEHAFATIVIVAQSFVEAMTDLAGNHGCGDNLRMWVLQARARVNAVVFENRDVRDAMIGA